MTPTVQAHHAGSLWVFDGTGWFLLLNVCGVEWSAQWCADPQKIEALRVNAQRLYARFPETLDELDHLGYTQGRKILNTPVVDAAGVAAWTDSLFNSCVPLAPQLHVGVLSQQQSVGGWHHYPKSIWDVQLTKFADFTLFVTDREGHQAAVVPVGLRGSGDGRVQVLWANTGSEVHARHMAAQASGDSLILDEGHELARLAFARQQ